MPILKIQDKKEYYELQHAKGMQGEIIQNLHDLTFYINGSEHGSNEYYLQHIFPLKDCRVLDSEAIQSFISNSRNSFLAGINLVGNLFSYPDFERFIHSLSEFHIQCTVHIMVQDFLDNMPKIKEINWPEHTQFNILVDAVFDISLIQDISLPFFLTAIVVSAEDFVQFSTLFETLSTCQEIRMIPLFNGKNLHFFASSVFVDKDDLENIDLSKNMD